MNPLGREHLGKLRLWRWITAGAGLVAAALLAKTLGLPGKGAERPKDDGSGYQIRDGEVIWHPTSRGGRVAATVLTLGMALNSEVVGGRKVPFADPTTFRTLGDHHGRDDTYVWFEATVIEGADPEQFIVLEYGFSRDETRIWQGAKLVFVLDKDRSEPLRVHSERVLSIGPKTWLTTDPPSLLHETPTSKPEHHCRDWFIMNEALWLGPRRVLELTGPTEVLDCDGGVRTRYEDDQPFEDLSFNQGILLCDGTNVWHATLTADPLLLATLPDPVVATRLLGRGTGPERILLARTRRSEVFAIAMTPETPAQRLGRFSDLPSPNDIRPDRSFWVEGRYFTVNDPLDPGAPLFTDHGPSERFGDLVLTAGSLLHGARVVARPGGLSLRELGPAMVLVGPSCLHYGHFVTDVVDPLASADELRPHCDMMHRRSHVLYEGLRISFHPRLQDLGASTEHPGMTNYQLGEFVLENTDERPRHLPVTFLEGFQLRVQGSPIAPPPDAWPTTGLNLAPGQRHAWPLLADSNQAPTLWGWTLYMQHSVARVPIFGDESFPIGNGGFRD